MPRGSRRSGKGTGTSSASLDSYRAKRDFGHTKEPSPEKQHLGHGPLTFVVQKHAARRLHYDLRLEFGGALKSWSVPKGPSLNPEEKRLAVMVEDHPVSYGAFEGAIPAGEYGAGQVIVWDNGTYSPDEGVALSFHDRREAEGRMQDGLAVGKLSFTLRGRKLRGSWTLVKTQQGENDWLLIKHRDGAGGSEADVLELDTSVVSGLTIEDLKAGRVPPEARDAGPALSPAGLPGAKRGALPKSLTPMTATLTDAPFSDRDWLFEPKLDGVRAVALMRNGTTRLLSRRGLDVTAQYPSLCTELDGQPASEVAFDGEIVALDRDGVPSFQLLQQRLNLSGQADIRRAETEVPVFYYIFDLLFLDGYDLRNAPLEDRKAQLARVLQPSNRLRLLEHFEEDGEAAYDAARQHGLEGVIAKRRNGVYESGRRSRHWLKIKTTASDDFVVGGYTAGSGGRAPTFGALLLGQYDGEGNLRYVANVGSGFDEAALIGLRQRLDSMLAAESPFDAMPQQRAGMAWVRPELVVEVKFAQWTRDGHLRAPVFQRIRDDKEPTAARRAEVQTPESQDGLLSRAVGAPGEQIASVLEQLQRPRQRCVLQMEGHRIPVTNLDKEFWPGVGKRRALTKRDLLVYLARVSPYLLPHVRDRPLTLTRYPSGIHGAHFYQKHWGNPLPDFVETVHLYSQHVEGDQEYLLCNNLPTLLWLGQLADLELHTWYSRVSPTPDGDHLGADFAGSRDSIERSLLNYPDFIVFDLDPYIYSGREAAGAEPELNRKAFKKTCEAARLLKEILDSLSLSAFVKTSGRTGLHIYVPILRQLDYGAVRAASETLSRFVLQEHPRLVTMEWTVEKRTGKVFLDHNQNARGKTLASIYSPRVAPEAPVSMPLKWDELDRVYPTDFTLRTAIDLLAERGDLWAGILEAKSDLNALLQATGAVEKGG